MMLSCYIYSVGSLKVVLPHDDGNQAHDRLIEAVEEIPKELALLLHVTNYQPKAHGEDH